MCQNLNLAHLSGATDLQTTQVLANHTRAKMADKHGWVTCPLNAHYGDCCNFLNASNFCLPLFLSLASFHIYSGDAWSRVSVSASRKWGQGRTIFPHYLPFLTHHSCLSSVCKCVAQIGKKIIPSASVCVCILLYVYIYFYPIQCSL